MGADGDRVCQVSLCDLWKSTATVRSLDEVAQLNRFADPKREDTLEVDILLVLFLLNYNDHTFIHIHSICIYHIYTPICNMQKHVNSKGQWVVLSFHS